ncbi:putative M3 family peptidase [Candidatus Promineifilum breve]|uniref:M3 family peptidase n=1 Tax=Candidatus Promineifilum breve TaxID=1806508 RepID=A0A160T8X8_9CHLR|nr:M3 family oligoendopeptidase [Candidatus Promineifilum breve]CUS05440.2 putative M3 family peptidase [Candidatus Promineifilum breve]
MSLSPIPDTPFPIDPTQWESFAGHFERLLHVPLDEANVRDWLREWSDLNRLVDEAGAIVYIESTLDTADPAREQAFLNYVENVDPNYRRAEQALKERLLAFAADDDAFGPEMRMALRKMRNQADLFREANVPLFTELAKLGNEYDKLTGAMKADWDGEEKNLSQLDSLLQNRNRATRERAWKTIMGLWQDKRAELNTVYRQMLELRRQIAENAGLPDFRAYTFRAYNRFDYTPDDSLLFHDAIEAVVVPAARRVYEKKRAQLGLDALRPWDAEVDAAGQPLQPYQGQDALIQGSLNMFEHVDGTLARQFATMAEEGLLDLDTRAGKALGGYCSSLNWRQRPYIFMNGDGTHDDLQTMLHEAGHAFHAFESYALPYVWQLDVPMEFCEVASMSMELLAAPYLTRRFDGFYTEAEAARARIEHLSKILTFLPYMAVVDGFQHWVYTHPEAALDAAACDKAWGDLWDRFMRGIDWTGFEAERVSGWHRKLHIFHVPFYYIEYGMAQVGALQVWRNALRDQAEAVATYRQALQLGGTRPLPELFSAAGAAFRFDEALLTELVDLIETTLAQLERAN